MSIGRGTFSPARDEHVDVRSFGADVTDSDCTAAFQQAADVAAASGGVMFIPAGTWTVTGTVTFQAGVTVRGAGAGATTVNHTGNNPCFDFDLGGSYTVTNGVEGIRITGNSGAAGVGLQVSDTWGFRIRNVTISGYTNGVGLKLYNRSHWTEGTEATGLWIRNCGTGISFMRSQAADGNTDSFGYTRLLNVGINVPAGGTGIFFGDDAEHDATNYIYNCEIHANIWLATNAVAMEFSSNSTGDGNHLHVTGENESGATGTRAWAAEAPGFFNFTGAVAVAADNTDFPSEVNSFLVFGDYRSGVKVQVGSATPEGDVSAPVGSIFIRNDGGAGSTLYVKESGTGNTGWAAK